jgi:hypothetical protein
LSNIVCKDYFKIDIVSYGKDSTLSEYLQSAMFYDKLRLYTFKRGEPCPIFRCNPWTRWKF